MDPNTRACIAYIAAKLISGSGGAKVYDHSRSKYIDISGSVSGTRINIYDHERKSHLRGTATNFFDSDMGAHLSINVDGNRFSGRIHDDNCRYSGTVNGKSITFYDYAESKHFNYSV